jgi:hypothetical protein
LNVEELRRILERFNFKLVYCDQKKIRLLRPEGITMTLWLKIPLERWDKFSLMRWILDREEYRRFIEEEGYRWDSLK